jgi:hypothetical protein
VPKQKKAVEADKMLSKAKQLGLTYGPQFYASQVPLNIYTHTTCIHTYIHLYIHTYIHAYKLLVYEA